jgi:hypothetical protein
MSDKRRKGPWFRLTQEESDEVERMMAELDAWEPGMGPPEHSVEEHIAAARLAMDDLKARTQRLTLLFAVWVLACLIFIGLAVYELVRWLS